MSVKELEKKIRALPRHRLERFGEWFDAFRGQAAPSRAPEDKPEERLGGEQKQEVLRRRAAYLANPSIATPWEGTADRLLKQLRARRRQKAPANRG